MSRAIRTAILALLVLIVLAPAAPAAAASQPWQNVGVVAHDEGGTTTLIVSGQLPETVSLPATVELSAPSGAQIMWAGEVLGGDLAADPEVEYTVTKAEGYDLYTFTLTKSRTGQAEFTIPSLVTTEGSNSKVDLTWTATTAVDQLEMRYVIPASAQIVTPAEDAEMIEGSDGFSYYARGAVNIKPGQTEAFSFVYSGTASGGAGAPSAPAAQPSSAANPALIAVFALVAATLALMVIGVRRKMALRDGGEGEDVTSAYEVPVGQRRASAQTSAGTSPLETRKSGVQPKVLMLGIVVVVFVIIAVIALNSGRTGVRTGDTIDMVYAQVDTCTTSNIGLTPPADADLEADADKVLESLRSVVGVGNATLHLGESRIEVRYCDSQVQESQILAALDGVGYTAAPLETATENIPQTKGE